MNTAAMTLTGLPFAPALLVVVLAMVIDAGLGDPGWLYRRVHHPVVLIGKAIAWLDDRLNAGEPRAPATAFAAGMFTTVFVVALASAVGYFLYLFCEQMDYGWLVEAVLASTLIAFRGLHDYVLAVAHGLDAGLDEGREAVSAIVGRDPASLDEAGVARAAVESLAENFSDGVVAPLFWFALLGLPGLVAYKAINTLDSMIGHRNERYLYFGRFAARLDDVVNLIPARLAGLLFALAALALPGASAGRALRSMWRYARKHRSPNAGWQEAALAGALGFALAGPRRYGAEIVEDAWMGDGRAELTPADIRKSLTLYQLAGTLMLVVCVVVWLLV